MNFTLPQALLGIIASAVLAWAVWTTSAVFAHNYQVQYIQQELVVSRTDSLARETQQNNRVATIESRLNSVEMQFGRIEERLQAIQKTLDNLPRQLGQMEEERPPAHR